MSLKMSSSSQITVMSCVEFNSVKEMIPGCITGRCCLLCPVSLHHSQERQRFVGHAPCTCRFVSCFCTGLSDMLESRHFQNYSNCNCQWENSTCIHITLLLDNGSQSHLQTTHGFQMILTHQPFESPTTLRQERHWLVLQMKTLKRGEVKQLTQGQLASGNL